MWQISIFLVGRLSKGEQKGGGEFFRRFRSQITFKYTSAVRSKICSSLLYAYIYALNQPSPALAWEQHSRNSLAKKPIFSADANAATCYALALLMQHLGERRSLLYAAAAELRATWYSAAKQTTKNTSRKTNI